MSLDPSDIDFAPDSASDRWVDAVLSEHARLGDDDDEELIHRILLETVRRPQSSPVVATTNFDWRSTLLGFGAVAAVIGLSLLILSSFSSTTPTRRSDELQFVVRVISPESNGRADRTPPRKQAGDFRVGPLELVATTPQGAPLPSLASVDLEWATPIDPNFGIPRENGERHEFLRITADRGHSVGGSLRYEGDVVVEHERFRIEADLVQLHSVRESSAESASSPLLANRVRVVQGANECVAEAETLQFDPVDGSLILTGVTRAETEKGELAHFAPNDRLVLYQRGFSVERGTIER